MPIRRNSPSPSAPSTPSRRPRRTAPSRAPRPVLEEPAVRQHVYQDTPQILSEEEKHELIRAHAHARQIKKPPVQHMAGYYVAVAASCLMVMTGWWFTADKNIHQNIAPSGQPDVFIDSVQTRAGSIANQTSEELKRLKQINDAIIEEQKVQEQAINSTSTTSTFNLR